MDAASDTYVVWALHNPPVSICSGVDLPKYVYSDISEGIYILTLNISRIPVQKLLVSNFRPTNEKVHWALRNAYPGNSGN